MKTTLKGDVNGKEIVYTASIKEVTNGMLIGQIDGARQLKLAEAINDKEKAIKLSLKYNILSRFTAFIAIDTSKKLPIDDIKTIKLTERSFYEEAQFASSYNRHKPGYLGLNVPAASNNDGFGLTDLKQCLTKRMSTFEDDDDDDDDDDEWSDSCNSWSENEEEEEGKVVNNQVLPTQLMAKRSSNRAPNPTNSSSKSDLLSCIAKGRSLKKVCETEVDSTRAGSIKEDNTSIVNQKQFDDLVELQKANGHFANIQKIYTNFADLEKKYSNLEMEVLSTIVAITLLRTMYKEKKIQWDLLVKKSFELFEKQGY
ncbi:Uncharacterized protein QTN25_008426 [Entamoeba marina]